MRKLTKLFLGLSLAGLALGVFVAHSNLLFHTSLMVLLPSGAIFFGLFLIFKVLEKESAQYDADHRKTEKPRESRQARQSAREDEHTRQEFTHAHSH